MNWESRWLNQDTPWDLGGPHPETERLMELLLSWRIPLGRVWIPGCGRAHDALVFLKHGLKVVGVDLSEAAIKVARDLWQETHGLELIHSRNEDFAESHKGHFSLVFDRAMLCALAPEGREGYVKAVFDSLVPGGIFASLAFQKLKGDLTGELNEELKQERKGPPFSIDEATMTVLLKDSFTLMGGFKVSKPSPLPIVEQETLWIWKKIEK